MCLLAASLTVTAVYMPTKLQGSHPVLPYVQGALGWLTFGQAIAMIALAGCVGWLAWHLRRGRTVSAAKDRIGSDPWAPMLGGMLTVVVAPDRPGHPSDSWANDRSPGGPTD